jgi:hypothetical protein
MTLEQQVASLVTATTDLTTVVNTELNKVRAENTAFKNGLSTSFTTEISTATSQMTTPNFHCRKIGGSPFVYLNNVSAEVEFNLANMAKGDAGLSGVSLNALILYRITKDINDMPSRAIPLIIQVDGSVRLGVTSGASDLPSQSFGFGTNALSSAINTYSNIVGLGSNSQVTGANQIQLGDPNTTTYAYGAVQNRSDLRDKADVRPTVLGLSFIKSLRPVDFRWDLRDSYRTEPPVLSADPSPEEVLSYNVETKKWQETNKLTNLSHNGSKKRSRYHHGIIAQELQSLIRTTGVDFGGFQDHKIAGGEDVLSVGYPEFIAPLIKAVQELSEMNEALNERVKALEAKVA